MDGFLADEQDSLDWLLVQDIDNAGPINYDAFIAGVGAIVMGRTTYEWVLGHMASSGEAWSYAMPTFVATHGELPGVDGARCSRAGSTSSSRTWPATGPLPARRTPWWVRWGSNGRGSRP